MGDQAYAGDRLPAGVGLTAHPPNERNVPMALHHRLIGLEDGAEIPVAPALDGAGIYPTSPFINGLDRYLWHRRTTPQHAIHPPT